MSPPERPSLSPEEIRRYSRHLTLPQVGMEGQIRLKQSAVLLVGAGGLGSPLAMYLAAAGVGRIGLVDFDVVDESNLQRQVLYGTADVGIKKVDRAARRIRELNPHLEVEPHDVRLDVDNALSLFKHYDLIIDGTDNFPTRYLVNDACVLSGRPNIYGSIFRFEGQVSIFGAPEGPCYRCLYPEPPAPGSVPNCAEGGVLGVLPGIIGTLQAMEAIKWILGQGEPLTGRLLLFDALEMRFRELTLRRDPACPLCGESPSIDTLIETDASCALEEQTMTDEDLDVLAVRDRLGREAPPFLLDVRTPQEWAICHLDEAVLLPLQELGARFDELPRDREIVVYCHSGIRSAQAASFLRGQGYPAVRNMLGGIDAWATEIDPAMPRY